MTTKRINDNDRMDILNVSHGAVAVELVLRLINNVLSFVERIDTDDHNLDVRTGSKLMHVGRLGGAVDKVLARNIAIQRGEMFLSHLNGLNNAFPDSLRRNDGDELGEAVLADQFKDGLGMHIGLASAGPHLNGRLRKSTLPVFQRRNVHN